MVVEQHGSLDRDLFIFHSTMKQVLDAVKKHLSHEMNAFCLYIVYDKLFTMRHMVAPLRTILALSAIRSLAQELSFYQPI